MENPLWKKPKYNTIQSIKQPSNQIHIVVADRGEEYQEGTHSIIIIVVIAVVLLLF